MGLAAFCNSIWRYRLNEKSRLPTPKGLPYVLITRRQHTTVHKATVARLIDESKNPKRAFGLFEAEIPQSADVPKAMELYPDNTTNTYPTYAAKWRSLVEVMDVFVHEMKGILNGSRR